MSLVGSEIRDLSGRRVRIRGVAKASDALRDVAVGRVLAEGVVRLDGRWATGVAGRCRRWRRRPILCRVLLGSVPMAVFDAAVYGGHGLAVEFLADRQIAEEEDGHLMEFSLEVDGVEQRGSSRWTGRGRTGRNE